jgi:hypothetical protein
VKRSRILELEDRGESALFAAVLSEEAHAEEAEEEEVVEEEV